MKKSYTAPTVTPIGTIAEATLAVKTFGVGDGFVLNSPDTPLCQPGLNCEDSSA